MEPIDYREFGALLMKNRQPRLSSSTAMAQMLRESSMPL